MASRDNLLFSQLAIVASSAVRGDVSLDTGEALGETFVSCGARVNGGSFVLCGARVDGGDKEI